MVSPASGDKYTELSRRYIQQAGEEFQRGDLLQASEKAWGAAAEATKSIAEQRGWRHNRHDLLYDISEQIADELDRRDLARLFRSASSLHINFYEDWMAEGHVAGRHRRCQNVRYGDGSGPNRAAANVRPPNSSANGPA